MNYYPFHVGDFISHTAHLSETEDLAYRRMLDAYYMSEQPLPADPKAVARLIRMRQHLAIIEALLIEFFDLQEAGWVNARCESELAKFSDRRTKAQASARASVNARRANAQRTLNERSTDVELPEPEPEPEPNLIPETLRVSTDRQAESADLLGDDIDDPLPCPHTEILRLWSELMPELQQPVKWTPARSAVLRSRWREEAVEHKWAAKEDGLKFFAKLFRWCRQSRFLMGQANARTPGATPFSLTLPWLTKSENWAKVQEGNYHSEG